ncbi:Atu4866 domain-containing protein [Kribbella sp. NPDC050124]|uniref:Atu4866 domain-containing protein n=1 Tax=Kribbella sp. NPDC050124 TaxID=3364114 RepID=UPI0037984689
MNATHVNRPVALLGMLLGLTACSSTDTTAPPTSQATSSSPSSQSPSSPATPSISSMSPRGATAVTGTWATADGQLRIELRADGTFVEDLNGTAYDGRYTVQGSTLTLSTSSGITTNGTIASDRIQISSYELRRAS